MRRISNRRRKDTLITAEEMYKKTTSHMDSIVTPSDSFRWRLKFSYDNTISDIKFVEVESIEFPFNWTGATLTLNVDSSHRTFSYRIRTALLVETSYSFTIDAGTYVINNSFVTVMSNANQATGFADLIITCNDDYSWFSFDAGKSGNNISILGMTGLSATLGIVGNPTYTTYAEGYEAFTSLMAIKGGNNHVRIINGISPMGYVAPYNNGLSSIRLSMANQYYNRTACFRNVALYECTGRVSITAIGFDLCDDSGSFESHINLPSGGFSMTINFYS